MVCIPFIGLSNFIQSSGILVPSVQSIMNIWRSGRWLLLLLLLVLVLTLCISIYALSDFVVASNLISSLPCSRSNWVLCPPWGVNYGWWPEKTCLSKCQLDWVWMVFFYWVWALLRLFHEYILKQYYYHYSFQCWWIVEEYIFWFKGKNSNYSCYCQL